MATKVGTRVGEKRTRKYGVESRMGRAKRLKKDDTKLPAAETAAADYGGEGGGDGGGGRGAGAADHLLSQSLSFLTSLASYLFSSPLEAEALRKKEDAETRLKLLEGRLFELKHYVDRKKEDYDRCGPEEKEIAKKRLATLKKDKIYAQKDVEEAKYDVWRWEKKIESIKHSPKWVKSWSETAKPLAEGEEDLYDTIDGPLPYFLNPKFGGAEYVLTVDPEEAENLRKEMDEGGWEEYVDWGKERREAEWQTRVRKTLGFLSTLDEKKTEKLLPDLKPFVMPATGPGKAPSASRSAVLSSLLSRTRPGAAMDARCQYITGSTGSSKSQLCCNLVAAIAISQPQLDAEGGGVTNVPIYVSDAKEANLLPSEAVAVGLAHRGMLFRKDEEGNLLMPSWVKAGGSRFVSCKWFIDAKLRLELFVDEAQGMFTREFGAYRGGLASRQLREAASVGSHATSTTLIGSSSVLNPLLEAIQDEELAEAYPGLRHARNVNVSKLVCHRMSVISEVKEAARFLEKTGKPEWDQIVKKVRDGDEDAVARVEDAIWNAAGNAWALSVKEGEEEEEVGLAEFVKEMGSALGPIAIALWGLTLDMAVEGKYFAKKDLKSLQSGRFVKLEYTYGRDEVRDWLMEEENQQYLESCTRANIEKAKEVLQDVSKVQQLIHRGLLATDTFFRYISLPFTPHAVVASAWRSGVEVTPEEIHALSGGWHRHSSQLMVILATSRQKLGRSERSCVSKGIEKAIV